MNDDLSKQFVLHYGFYSPAGNSNIDTSFALSLKWMLVDFEEISFFKTRKTGICELKKALIM